MTEKYLEVIMPDGSKWDIPAKIIAENRAKYYAEHDTDKTSGEEFDKVFKEEVELLLNDPDGEDVIIDWAANNMNWSDVKDFAVKVSDMEVDYQEGWVNGDKEVIKK
jgi:hypothetical protein